MHYSNSTSYVDVIQTLVAVQQSPESGTSRRRSDTEHRRPLYKQSGSRRRQFVVRVISDSLMYIP